MKYKLVCFDLDGTLVDDTASIWQTLHEHFGTDMVRRKSAMERFMRHEMTYSEWADHDVEMFKEKGATREEIISVIKRLKLMTGSRLALKELKDKGLKLAVISGSIDLVLETLFPEHPFDDVFINRFIFDDSGRLVSGVGTEYEREHKATGLKMIAKRERFNLSECVFVGDNLNDIQVAQTAGLSIAFNSNKDELKQVCSVVIPDGIKDVRAVLPHILEVE